MATANLSCGSTLHFRAMGLLMKGDDFRLASMISAKASGVISESHVCLRLQWDSELGSRVTEFQQCVSRGKARMSFHAEILLIV